MDRQGYTGTYDNTGAGHKPLGQTIKEHVPGTPEYQAMHGTTGAHSGVEQMKERIPGTEEHRMRQMGVTSHSHDTAGHHIGATGHSHAAGTGPSMGEKIKQNIPGTNEYEATHGITNAHRNAEQMKAHIPGTEEHRIHEATRPAAAGAGTGLGGGHTYDTPGDHKSMGQKIKEAIPGTREHEAKKMEQGRF